MSSLSIQDILRGRFPPNAPGRRRRRGLRRRSQIPPFIGLPSERFQWMETTAGQIPNHWKSSRHKLPTIGNMELRSCVLVARPVRAFFRAANSRKRCIEERPYGARYDDIRPLHKTYRQPAWSARRLIAITMFGDRSQTSFDRGHTGISS